MIDYEKTLQSAIVLLNVARLDAQKSHQYSDIITFAIKLLESYDKDKAFELVDLMILADQFFNSID